MLPIDDDKIDEAARSLTEGAPGADVRARVLARIDQAPRRTPIGSRLLAIAAIAAVVVAAVIYRTHAPMSTPTEVAPAPAAALSSPAPDQSTDSQGGTFVSTLEPEAIVIPPIEVAELVGPTPIVIDELTVEPILMGAIDATPGNPNQ